MFGVVGVKVKSGVLDLFCLQRSKLLEPSLCRSFEIDATVLMASCLSIVVAREPVYLNMINSSLSCVSGKGEYCATGLRGSVSFFFAVVNMITNLSSRLASLE